RESVGKTRSARTARTGRARKRRPETCPSAGTMRMRPTRRSRRASSTSSISGWSGNPPARWNASRRTNTAWSPYGRRVVRERRSARRSRGPSQLRPPSAWVCTRKAPATTPGSARVRSTHAAASGGSEESACRKRRTSPHAALAPAFICIPRPRGASRTRTPGTPRATSTVPSRLPPSTTTISSIPVSARSSVRRSPMRRTSSSTGMTTESRTRPPSGDRAAAARPGAGRAAEAVPAGRDGGSVERREIVDVPDGGRPRRAARQPPHLSEVAVVQPAVPSPAGEVAAHQPGHGGGIEVVPQQAHVTLRLAGPRQLRGEAADRHVRDGEQVVEGDAEALAQAFAVLRLQLLLRRRQEGTDRVVDQVEAQRRLGTPVAERVQRAQRLDALREDAGAALPVDVLRAVA